jgi:hypothetical protein
MTVGRLGGMVPPLVRLPLLDPLLVPLVEPLLVPLLVPLALPLFEPPLAPLALPLFEPLDPELLPEVDPETELLPEELSEPVRVSDSLPIRFRPRRKPRLQGDVPGSQISRPAEGAGSVHRIQNENSQREFTTRIHNENSQRDCDR